MESFYGGSKGADFRLTGSYPSVNSLKQDFQSPNCPVKVGEYAIVNPPITGSDTIDTSNVDYGMVYLREANGEATKAGCMKGATGAAWTLSGILIGGVSESTYATSSNKTINLGTGETFTITCSNENVCEQLSANEEIGQTILDNPQLHGISLVYSVAGDLSVSQFEDYPTLYLNYDVINNIWYETGLFALVENTTTSFETEKEQIITKAQTMSNDGCIFFVEDSTALN